MEMISFGGGVNSVAMTVMLVNEGWRGPVVFADTGGEHPETYCYLKYFDGWLKERGLRVETVSPVTHPELYGDKRIGSDDGAATLEEFCLQRDIIPLLAVRWCSVMFKGDPLRRWRALQAIQTTYLGICADEPRRVRDDPTNRYPLVERDITRGGCARIIRAEGLEVPRKSGCFFCPGQRLSQWRDLYQHHPGLYERAAQLERKVSVNIQRSVTLTNAQSLDQMRERRWQGQIEMDLSEWLPCICTL